MSVKFQVHDLTSCAKRIEVEYLPEAVERQKDTLYRNLNRRVRIHGFRPGKAPRRILERLYGAQVDSEVLQTLITDAYRKVQEEHQLTALGEPKIEEVQMREGAPLTFAMELEVLPEFELPDLSGLEFTKKVVNVSDEAVERELEYLRDLHAEFEVVEDPVVQADDLVVLSYEEIDPDPSGQSAGAKNYQFVMGQHPSTQALEEQLVGMRPHEVREVTLANPSSGDSRTESEVKPMGLRVTVHEIKKKRLPALDEEFARSIDDCETLEDLRRGLRERLEALEDQRATEALHREVMDKAVELSPIEVPEMLLEQELLRMVQGVREEMQGANADLSRPELSEERLRMEFRDRALRNVREELMVSLIAKREEITISQEDVDKEIERIARRLKQNPASLKESFERKGTLQRIRFNLLHARTLGHLAGKVQVREERIDAPAEVTAGGEE